MKYNFWTGPGIAFGQVITGVLGVLSMTSEYSSGLIAPTLAAVPRRPLVLWAKALVLGAATLAAGEIATFASFGLGIAVLRSSVPHPSLGQGTVLRAVVMTGAYLAIIALTGLGIGAIVRHGAAAVATLVGGLFVLPILTGAAGRGLARFMPEVIAGNSLAGQLKVAVMRRVMGEMATAGPGGWGTMNRIRPGGEGQRLDRGHGHGRSDPRQIRLLRQEV